MVYIFNNKIERRIYVDYIRVYKFVEFSIVVGNSYMHYRRKW
nr:MAG TPA: Kappa-carrageenase [Caudoviricetes sp.]